MHPKLTALGEASLKGWRGRMARPVANAVARRSDFSADQVRAVFGLAFFALSVYLLSRPEPIGPSAFAAANEWPCSVRPIGDPTAPSP